MATLAARDGHTTETLEDPDAEVAARRSRDRIRAVMRWCEHRAGRKCDWVLRIAPLRYTDMSHEQVRLRVGLTVEEYRRTKRWLNEAVARCAGSPHPLTLDQALEEISRHHVSMALRVGMMRESGRTRDQIRAALKLSEEEYDMAGEWYRDGLRAVVDLDE